MRQKLKIALPVPIRNEIRYVYCLMLCAFKYATFCHHHDLDDDLSDPF